MERIQGLKEYTRSRKYREAVGIPEDAEVNYNLLAQGEYNINYYFTHPVNQKKLLLRVNCGSQMHLDRQIEYEFGALKQLEPSERTPKPVWADGSKADLDHGIMVMEYLEGRPLDYRIDLELAAECLADIHSTVILHPEQLISPQDPLQAILEECETMFAVYEQSPLTAPDKSAQIRRMLNKAWAMVGRSGNRDDRYKCCINTELNSTNFLINGKAAPNYLIDWEKPLYGMPAQDLGHFLAPTTTFWKTDVILSEEAVQEFIRIYQQAVNDRFPAEDLEEDVAVFIPVTCMRGITWCAMAWVQYQQPDKLIFNQSTFDKLNNYLENNFLNDIERRL